MKYTKAMKVQKKNTYLLYAKLQYFYLHIILKPLLIIEECLQEGGRRLDEDRNKNLENSIGENNED